MELMDLKSKTAALSGASSTPEKLIEIPRQAFRSSFEDSQFHEQYRKLLGLRPTPVMPEDQQKLGAELPPDIDVVKVFETIAGMGPFPSHS